MRTFPSDTFCIFGTAMSVITHRYSPDGCSAAHPLWVCCSASSQFHCKP